MIILIIVNQQEKIIYHQVDFAVPPDYRVKIKESEQIDKYLNLKRLWQIRVTGISIVAGAFKMAPKDLEKRLDDVEIRRRINTIQTTALLRPARKFRRVLDT